MFRLAFAWTAAAAFAASLVYFLHAYLFVFGPPPAAAPRVSSGSDQGVWGPLLANVALFTLFAAHHSAFARTGAKNLIRRLATSALERAIYTLVASVLFAAVCALWQPIPGHAWTLRGVWRWLGYATQVAGIVLTIAGARALDVWELAGVRQAKGDTKRPAALETTGLYGFVRHPLYFAWILLVFGAPDMSATRLSFAAVSTAYLAAAIPLEERSLVETFGPAYASYRKQVRWRMVPWIY